MKNHIDMEIETVIKMENSQQLTYQGYKNQYRVTYRYNFRNQNDSLYM